eukprot:5801534-Alexandrium_andersonii.AAC.1
MPTSWGWKCTVAATSAARPAAARAAAAAAAASADCMHCVHTHSADARLRGLSRPGMAAPLL